ncbi:hypothetical protein SUDANB21_00573 [Streptomyces sp. enrichment culture]
MVGARDRYGELVSGVYVGGEFRVGGEEITRFAVPADHGDPGRTRGAAAADQARGVPDAVQGRARVVALPPSTATKTRPPVCFTARTR